MGGDWERNYLYGDLYVKVVTWRPCLLRIDREIVIPYFVLIDNVTIASGIISQKRSDQGKPHNSGITSHLIPSHHISAHLMPSHLEPSHAIAASSPDTIPYHHSPSYVSSTR